MHRTVSPNVLATVAGAPLLAIVFLSVSLLALPAGAAFAALVVALHLAAIAIVCVADELLARLQPDNRPWGRPPFGRTVSQ